MPEGYTEDQRGKPGGFVGDPDVMDTWATSSLTPLVAGGWEDDPDLFERVFPMDLRPQAHDIIRTWLFSTVVRAELELGRLPWTDVAISGWVLDPDRKKMSKSKGNVVTPMPLHRKARGRRRPVLGGQRPAGHRHRRRRGADEGRPAPGHQGPQRLQVRPRPAGRRAGARARGGDRAHRPDLLARLAAVVTDATAAFEAYDYARALELAEEFFWSFCDDYLELVKTRAYGDPDRPRDRLGPGDPGAGPVGAAPAVRAVPPFVTEEVWSWWQAGSVHQAIWPAVEIEIEPALTGEGLVRRLPDPGDDRRGAGGGPPGEDHAEALDAGPPVARLTVVDTAERLERCDRPRATCGTPEESTSWSWSRGPIPG